jgi:aromatic-amino-acid transaminase
MSLFSALELAPRDPILGITEGFNADTRPGKINLGVGVYYDANGKLPLLKCVQQAEADRVATQPARGYLPIDGIVMYNKAVQELLFGAGSALLAEKRVATFQALGGTGALKIAADFLKRVVPQADVWISNPSWENHRALFESAGFPVKTHPYFDEATNGVDFAGMKAAFNSMAAQSIVVLHACCHNPTGVDLSPAQWQEITDICKARQLVPILDLAYQGFGDGIEEDSFLVRQMIAANVDFFVASSFSKSFSLYGERVGALSVVAASGDESVRLISQVKRVIRTNYSNPPTHGATVVATVLQNPTLRAIWEAELGEMRVRIKAMRTGLQAKLKAHGVTQNFDHIVNQRGMFSYSGLTEAQVDRLRDEFGIYALGTGRICMAAINDKNIDTIAAAIAKVL